MFQFGLIDERENQLDGLLRSILMMMLQSDNM